MEARYQGHFSSKVNWKNMVKCMIIISIIITNVIWSTIQSVAFMANRLNKMLGIKLAQFTHSVWKNKNICIYNITTKPQKTSMILQIRSSHGGLEVEKWSNNRTLSILVDQSPLGECILYGTNGPAMLCAS